MANIKSSIKRVKINEQKRTQNQSVKSEMRSYIKRVEELVNEKNVDEAKATLKVAISKIDKAAQKGILHKNNADRKKASLTKKVNAL